MQPGRGGCCKCAGPSIRAPAGAFVRPATPPLPACLRCPPCTATGLVLGVLQWSLSPTSGLGVRLPAKQCLLNTLTGEASREQGSCLPLLASQTEEGVSPADLLPASQMPVPAPSPP